MSAGRSRKAARNRAGRRRSEWALRETGGSLVTVALATALILSLGLHVANWLGRESHPGPRVIRFIEEGSSRQPTLILDFDAPMVAADRLDRPLPDGLVTIDPPAPVSARFLTPRRLRVQVERPLDRFQRMRVVFGPAFADVAGRPPDTRESIAFTTGRLALKGGARARFDVGGRPVCTLEFNGPVSPQPLRDHLHLTDDAGDPLPFELIGADDSWALRLEQTPPRGARLRITEGLQGRWGPAGLPYDVAARLQWPRDLRVVGTDVAGAHPARVISLTFSHVLAPADATPFVEVEPRPDDLTVEVRGAHLILTGSFPPRRHARIHLRRGLLAVAGMALEEDVVRSVLVPAPPPDVRIRQQGSTLSTAARPEIHVEGINVPALEVELREVFPNNVVPLALGWERSRALAAPAITKRIPVDARPDETWTRTLDLARLLGRPPRGVYHLTVKDPRSYWDRATRLLQVTDLAPVVRVTPRGMVVFVSRLSDGEPIEGAHVESFDAKNQPCVSGTTDQAGIFRTERFTSEPFVVTVTTSDDRAWVDLRTHALAHTPRDVQGRSTPAGLEAYVYVDRGVVRPGETAHVTALVRAPDGTSAPGDLPLSLNLRAPDRRIVVRRTGRTDPHGMAAVDLPFALDAPTGPYVLEVAAPGIEAPIGRVAFRVEAVVPDRLEPVLTLPAGDLEPGASVPVGLGAKLLTGAPMGGLPARLRVRYRPVFDGPGDGFAFGDRFAAPAPFADAEVRAQLDANGRAEVAVELPDVSASGASLRATFELEVVDVSGRAAFTRAERRVAPGGPRLGIARPGDGPLVFDVVLVGAETGSVRASLERVRTVGSWRLEGRRSVWRGEEIAEPVTRASLSIESGRGRLRFPDPGDGRFRVRVEAEAAAPAAIGFERWGGRSAEPRPAGAPRLALALVDGPVEPGGTAAIAVEAPVAGRALLTVETTTPLAARVVQLKAGMQHVAVEIPDVAAPNVHVTLTLVRGARDAGQRPARLLGAVAVPLQRPKRRVDVALDVPSEARPDSRVALTVRTSAPATLRVHLVDEGILRLTGHGSPDPLGYLEATRRLDTRVADVYATLLERMRFGGEDAESGGGANLAARLDPTAKKTIETVALASRLVPCDGETTVAFDLPPYEGRLRAFVVAAGAEGTGAASAGLVVRGPISIAIHVPRAVAPGDVFEVPVEVQGDEVTWELQLEGLQRLPGAGALRVRAEGEPGVAQVTVRARDVAGNEAQRTARLSVRPAAPYTTLHRVTRIAADRSLTERVPGRWLRGHAKARLVVGDAPGLEVLPALERLMEYPHGCVEQTTSRGFSVLAFAELLRATHPEGLAPEDVVGAAVDRILSMQTPDGGLAFWPGGDVAYDFGSDYGAHFLLEARRFGRAVSKAPLETLLDHLEGRLRGGQATAYTARVLALAGRSVAPYLDALANDATTAEERADLAAAFLRTGNGPRARTLLGEAGDPWAAPREQGGRLTSPVRAAATLLSALVEVAPDDPRVPDLAARLAAEARRGVGTTQESAATLLALAKYHALRATEPAARGRLTVGGVEHAYRGDGLQVDFDPAAAPDYALRAEGPTTVVLRVAGIPLEPPAEGVERGLSIARRIEAPTRTLKQGHVYRVVIEGVLPLGAENVLVTDVLPGGLEIEAARDQEGTLEPDRVEPRDDRVLFFRTAALPGGAFRQTYLVRAVTVGTFRVPPIAAELLYAPELYARGGAGETLEIER